MIDKRYHDLDALRAFAMLLGIVLHGLLSFVGWSIWPVQDVNQSELYGVPVMFIHGFRMSLFFFVSGFFTMMMWQRRGAGGLLVHRFKRIVLPFFVFGLLVFPMLNNMKAFADWVGEGREERVAERSEGKETLNSKYEVPDNLGGVARQGDLDAIEKFLEEGADIDGKYDKDFTPLHWAAAMGEVEAIELLADRGANLNSRDGHKSTPMILAAFLGQPESVRILLEKGADPKLRNKDGGNPVDSTRADRGTTEWVARDILQISIAWSEVQEGRKEVRKLLGGDGQATVAGERNKGKDNWFARNYLAYGQFLTHHLWFLYDLVYLVLAFVITANILKLLPLPGFSRWLAESPLRLLWLLPLTYWAQYSMKEDFGPMTAVWLEPDWIKLGYYSIFFGYGAICFGHAGFHEKVGRFWPIHFLISIGIFVVALTLLERRDLEWRYELISICSTLFVWLMTFGLIGAFRKFFSGENPRIRYLSDSAYWLYVAHLPLIQVVQLWVAEWPIPSLIKTVFVCVFTTALLLLSYRYLIRYTWVGTMLNGKRTLPSPG